MLNRIIKNKFLCLIASVAVGIAQFTASAQEHKPSVKVLKSFKIYEDSLFYNAFPSVIKKQDGEYLLSFRRAPNREKFGEKGYRHVDHNSYLVGMTSKDGENWSPEPHLIYAHPFGGSQDPCLLQLSDGTLLCVSYGWTTLNPQVLEKHNDKFFNYREFTFLGGYLVRSTDGGKTWKGPHYPINIPDEIHLAPDLSPLSAYNRGALYEASNGDVLWIVAAHDRKGKTSNYLIRSKDKGLTWEYSGVVAKDDIISFNEASVIQTPKGDIIGFLRTANFGDQAVISRSTDGGKTFEWESMGFKGHPINALQLPDGRVLVTYGYRHELYGVRCRILNSECTNWAEAEEFIIRTDGGSTDIGYTWPVLLEDGKVLVVYYFNHHKDGLRSIQGSILDIY